MGSCRDNIIEIARRHHGVITAEPRPIDPHRGKTTGDDHPVSSQLEETSLLASDQRAERQRAVRIARKQAPINRCISSCSESTHRLFSRHLIELEFFFLRVL
jgi:hypothetical protein